MKRYLEEQRTQQFDSESLIRIKKCWLTLLPYMYMGVFFYHCVHTTVN